jgi:hypothetical protein
MYPVTIVDNFFEDPDHIVEYAETLDYTPNDGRYPGFRTTMIGNNDPRMHSYICEEITKLFYHGADLNSKITTSFQKVYAVHDDQYHQKNRGWVHRDGVTQFGGVVYLNKDPEPDTGTSIYSLKKGYVCKSMHEYDIEQTFNLGKDIPDEIFAQAYDEYHEQFVETIKVDAVYNRLVLFNSKTWHGIKTFGTKTIGRPRLNLTFFGAISSLETHAPLNR